MGAVVEIWLEYLIPFLQWDSRIVHWYFLQDENSRRIYRIIGMGWALSNVLAAANP